MHRRVLVLPVAAVVIAGLCAYKLTRTDQTRGLPEAPPSRRPAPAFALFDHHKPPRPVRLASYLGRHRILLVFFDGPAGFDRDPVLSRLLRHGDEISSADPIVLGISTALPQENRAIIGRLIDEGVLSPDGRLPFLLLSDVDFQVHQAWGCWDEGPRRTRPGIFLIDRAGNVEWDTTGPRRVADVEELMSELLPGSPAASSSRAALSRRTH